MKNNSYYTEEEKKQRFNFIPFVSPLTHRVYIIYKDGTTCSSPANFQTDEEAISTAKDYINSLTMEIPVEKVIVLKYDKTGACDNAIYEGTPKAKPQEIKTIPQSKKTNNMKAYIIKHKNTILCAVQSTIDISHNMLKNGYSIEEAEIDPIPTTEIAVNHGHGWEHAKHYAMHNGQKIEYKYSFFGF
jgi:hypothetical protein